MPSAIGPKTTFRSAPNRKPLAGARYRRFDAFCKCEIEAMTALFHDDTAVVNGVNGIPWWYFHGLESPYAGRHV